MGTASGFSLLSSPRLHLRDDFRVILAFLVLGNILTNDFGDFAGFRLGTCLRFGFQLKFRSLPRVLYPNWQPDRVQIRTWCSCPSSTGKASPAATCSVGTLSVRSDCVATLKRGSSKSEQGRPVSHHAAVAWHLYLRWCFGESTRPCTQ